MSYYDEDFYQEPSEFERQIDEFKESLSKAVKDEFLSEMDRLKKENSELQEVKKNFKNIKAEYDSKHRELEWERKELERKVRGERLSELMKDCQIELYSVASKGHPKPKCNKCDEDRKLHYKTPSGRETYEMCDCDRNVQVYEPIIALMNSFRIQDGKGIVWYKVKESKYSVDEYLEYYEDSISGKGLITSEEQFKDIGYAYGKLFETKELAQKFCDYKNIKEEDEWKVQE